MKKTGIGFEDLQAIQKEIKGFYRRRIMSILRSKKSFAEKVNDLLVLCNRGEE
jgi:hypothetical protein